MINESISQIVILNYYKRESEGKYLKKLVEISAKPLGIPVQISFDKGDLGLWKNYCNALTMGGGNDGTHRLVIHDDVSFDRNILEKIIYVLKHAPEHQILSFYNPSNKDYKECSEAGRHILKTDCNFWCQAMLFPNDTAREYVEMMDVAAKSNRAEDSRLKAFLQIRKESLYAVVPSMIQHMGAFRSSLGNSGKVLNNVRYSKNYDSGINVESINWEEEFQNPWIAKLKYDSVKYAMQKEFYEIHKSW